MNVPFAAKVWVGFWSVDVPASPKVHAQDSTVPSPSLLVSVNSQTRWSHETVKELVGGTLAVTDMGRVVLLVALSSSSTVAAVSNLRKIHAILQQE